MSCQEPSPLKGSKHSLQRHPHDAALVNAHSFVSMGVEAMCRPCHSTAHCRHMKRQPSCCHCCPHHGCRYCNRCRRLRCHCQLGCCCRCRRPLLLPSPLVIAVAVAADHRCRRLCHVAVSHCHCPCPCRQPLPAPPPLAIAVARRPFPRVVALVRQELYSNNSCK